MGETIISIGLLIIVIAGLSFCSNQRDEKGSWKCAKLCKEHGLSQSTFDDDYHSADKCYCLNDNGVWELRGIAE